MKPEETQNIPTVEEQYRTDSYSNFVSNPTNEPFYKYFIHYSFLKLFKENSSLKIWKKILDIGCGDGILIRKLYQLYKSKELTEGLKIIGIDSSSAMLKKAQELNQIEQIPKEIIEFYLMNFINYQSNLLLYKDFDIIYTGFVLFHMKNYEELKIFLNNCYKLLRKGGKTIHLLPNTIGEKTGNIQDGHVDRVELMKDVIVYDIYWSGETLIKLMNEIGFKNVMIEMIKVSPEGEKVMGIEWTEKMNSLEYKILKGDK